MKSNSKIDRMIERKVKEAMRRGEASDQPVAIPTASIALVSAIGCEEEVKAFFEAQRTREAALLQDSIFRAFGGPVVEVPPEPVASADAAKVIADASEAVPEINQRFTEILEEERRLEPRRRRAAALAKRFPPSDLEAIVMGHRQDPNGVRRIVREWHGSKIPVLILAGRPGTGKSYAAALWFIAKGGAFVSERGLCNLNMGWSEDRKKYERIVDGMHHLVVDEVGQHRDAERAKEVLFDILERRNDKRTILVTNGDADGFRANRTDDRILSRIRATAPDGSPSRVDFRAVDGPDLRQRHTDPMAEHLAEMTTAQGQEPKRAKSA